jgi:hypothetical protein
MRIVKLMGEAAAVVAAMWIGYNMVVFAEIAAGKHMKYVPYLNFPIKIFVAALS